MNKVDSICPYCKKTTSVARKSFGGGYQEVQCAHCSKSWQEDLSDSNQLAKSFQSTSLAELRVQIRAQFDELQKQIIALQERRAAAIRPAKFQTGGVEKSDAASQELEKALANGKRMGFQPSEHGASARFRPAETVAPGVQRFRSASDGDANFHETPGNTLSATHVVEKAPAATGERRRFQPGGETDLGKANAEVQDALAKGTPVGR